MKKNVIIYEEAKKHNIHLWQIAKKLGIADTTLSKRLREELSQEDKDLLLRIIHEAASEKMQVSSSFTGIMLNTTAFVREELKNEQDAYY